METRKINGVWCYSIKEIAIELGIKPDTARKYLKDNKQKLGKLKPIKDALGKIWIPVKNYNSVFGGKTVCSRCQQEKSLTKLDGEYVCSDCRKWIA